MTKHAKPHLKTSVRGASALLLCLLLSGCNLLPGGSNETIQEPPLIPEPATELQSAESDHKPLIAAYADLIDFNDITLYHPQLHEAVSTATNLGILKPTSTDEKFEPQNPIQYGEFRKWSILYQGAATGMDMLPVTPAQTELAPKTGDTKSPVSTPSTTAPNPSPMSPANLMILPSELQWGEHRLSETRVLTREELCALYTFLSQQDTAARALPPSDIEAARPGWKSGNRDSANPDEALSQFKDYPSMGNWARRYVAVAYRDGILQKIFGLTPNQLTIDDGLNPQKEITRGEAIVLLHSLFSQEAVKRQALKPTEPQPNTNPGMVDPVNVLPPASPSQIEKLPAPPGKPQPVSHIKTIQETGPNGSKSAIQVHGPD